MKLIDVFPDALTGSGIFDALNTYNVPWKTDISSISLDLEYFGNVSGDKTVSPLIRKLSINGVLSSSAIAKIAQSLYNMHGLRWTKLWNTYQLEYNPIQNYNMTEIMSDDDTVTTYGRTHSKTGTEVDDRTRTDDNTESVYGFNSSNASDSEESDRTINDDNTHTYNVSDTDTGSDRQSHSYELTRSGNIGVTTSQQMIESERALWMWRYFYDVVFPDVDKMLTISIYSDDFTPVISGGITPTGDISIVLNGEYDITEYAAAIVNVPNTYNESDNGKVVDDGALVSQTSREISENGTYDTTLNNAVVVDVPNSYTAADEGKVVVNGSLAGQSTITVTENGIIDTTTNNEVIVSVSGGGGVEEPVYVGDFTPNTNANQAVTGGWVFTTSGDGLKVGGLRFYARTSICNVYISTASGEVVASKQNASVTSDRWNDLMFDVPVMLDANTQYVVWGSNVGIAMRYYNSSINPSLVTYNGGRYSSSYNTFPQTSENNVAYGVDIIAMVTSARVVPLISETVWNSLTTEEKQTYGFVAIQTADIGYNRGILVNGVEYESEV